MSIPGTRNESRWLLELNCNGFCTTPRIQIARNNRIERMLLDQPRGVNKRRHTIDVRLFEDPVNVNVNQNNHQNAIALLGRNKDVPLHFYGRPRRQSFPPQPCHQNIDIPNDTSSNSHTVNIDFNSDIHFGQL